jgi:hypothetical protein
MAQERAEAFAAFFPYLQVSREKQVSRQNRMQPSHVLT